MYKLILLLLSLPGSFLVVDLCVILGGHTLAQPQLSIANQSQPVQRAECGRYCENYPPGMTAVRLRDWQR